MTIFTDSGTHPEVIPRIEKPLISLPDPTSPPQIHAFPLSGSGAQGTITSSCKEMIDCFAIHSMPRTFVGIKMICNQP